MSLSILVLFPVTGSLNNSVNTLIFAKFNNPIQTGTIHMTVIDGSGNNVPGTIVYDSGNNIINYNKTFPLNLSSDYIASGSGITDTSGSIRAPFSWSFQTASTLGSSAIGSRRYLIYPPGGNRDRNQLQININ